MFLYRVKLESIQIAGEILISTALETALETLLGGGRNTFNNNNDGDFDQLLSSLIFIHTTSNGESSITDPMPHD